MDIPGRKIIMRFLFALLWAFFTVMAYGQVKDVVPGNYTPGFYSVQNFVKNPDCFANTRYITASGTGGIARNTTTPLRGIADCSISGSASGDKVTFAGRTFETALKGQNCELNFIYAGDASKWKAYAAIAGTAVSQALQLESTIDGSSVTQSKTASILYPCGSASSPVDIILEATAATPLTFKMTKLQSGLATNMGKMAQAFLTGTANWPITALCSWDNTATSYANFPVDSDCPNPTVTGSVSAPATKVPAITFNATAGRTYQVVVTGTFYSSNADSKLMRLSDGTVSTNEVTMFLSGDIIPSNTFTYIPTSSGIKTLNVQTRVSSGSITLYNQSVGGNAALQFSVYEFPAASEVVQTAEQKDTDWISFTPTGTWSTNTTYSGKWRRVGDEMEIQYLVSTSGAPTAVALKLNMPSGYLIDSSKLLTSTDPDSYRVGQGTAVDAGVQYYTLTATYETSSIIFINRDSTSTGANPVNINLGSSVVNTSPFTWGAGDYITIKVKVPIQGWIKSGVIVGSLQDAVNSYGTGFGADIQSVYFGSSADCSTACTTGNCTICHQVGTKITSVSWSATGTYNVNGIDGTKYDCGGTGSGANYVVLRNTRVFSTSTYARIYAGYNVAVQDSAYNYLICVGK
jgi:hypothetical protein